MLARLDLFDCHVWGWSSDKRTLAAAQDWRNIPGNNARNVARFVLEVLVVLGLPHRETQEPHTDFSGFSGFHTTR